MDERHVQNALWCSMHGSIVVAPNFTPVGWFECDMFSVSKSGYWSEHEIKLTVSDFNADAEKCLQFWRPRTESDEPGPFSQVREKTWKHDLLAVCDVRGPSLFWYVMPEDVAKSVVIPAWAGLKIARPDSYRARIAKQAPRLHKQPASDKLIEQARIALYWRYWRMRVYKNAQDPPTEANGVSDELGFVPEM